MTFELSRIVSSDLVELGSGMNKTDPVRMKGGSGINITDLAEIKLDSVRIKIS